MILTRPTKVRYKSYAQFELSLRSDANSTGLPSDRPIIEMTIPSVMDPTLAPEGKHSIGLFTQYSPILRNGTDRWSDQDREDYTNKILSQIDEYAPGFKDSGRSTKYRSFQ